MASNSHPKEGGLIVIPFVLVEEGASVCEHEVEKQEQYHSSLARVELLSRTEVG